MCNLATEQAGVGLAAEICLFYEGKKEIKKIFYTGKHTSSFYYLLHLKSSSLVLCWCILFVFFFFFLITLTVAFEQSSVIDLK